MAEDDLFSLARDLADAPRHAAPLVKKAVEVTARNIKEDWREGAAVEHHGPKNAAPAYQYAIDYDIIESENGVRAEIGPSLGRTKGAGHGFLEDGGGDVRSAPQHAGRDALEKNQDDFDAGLSTALWDATVGKRATGK
jgi:hypothetical protein